MDVLVAEAASVDRLTAVGRVELAEGHGIRCCHVELFTVVRLTR